MGWSVSDRAARLVNATLQHRASEVPETALLFPVKGESKMATPRDQPIRSEVDLLTGSLAAAHLPGAPESRPSSKEDEDSSSDVVGSGGPKCPCSGNDGEDTDD